MDSRKNIVDLQRCAVISQPWGLRVESYISPLVEVQLEVESALSQATFVVKHVNHSARKWLIKAIAVVIENVDGQTREG